MYCMVNYCLLRKSMIGYLHRRCRTWPKRLPTIPLAFIFLLICPIWRWKGRAKSEIWASPISRQASAGRCFPDCNSRRKPLLPACPCPILGCPISWVFKRVPAITTENIWQHRSCHPPYTGIRSYWSNAFYIRPCTSSRFWDIFWKQQNRLHVLDGYHRLRPFMLSPGNYENRSRQGLYWPKLLRGESDPGFSGKPRRIIEILYVQRISQKIRHLARTIHKRTPDQPSLPSSGYEFGLYDSGNCAYGRLFQRQLLW